MSIFVRHRDVLFADLMMTLSTPPYFTTINGV
jgi:hypothetical protein